MSCDLLYEPTEDFAEKMRSWLYCDELWKLVEAFGGKYPGEHHDADIVEWLLSFSERWDFRGKQRSTLDAGTGERARWLIESADLNDRQKRSIEDACIPLGLKGVSAPKLKNYDYIVALGGARMSCLYRTKYAYEILQRDDIETEEMVLLASLRKIAASERNATDAYAPGAETEYDLMCRALEKTADISGEAEEQDHHAENENFSWKIRKSVDGKTGKTMRVIAAPSRSAERRANTADTYKFFLEQEGKGVKKSLLLVTSQIYVPYQHIEAVRIIGMPYKLCIDTIGFPLEWNVGGQSGMGQYENYLQEIRSTIQAIGRLHGEVR